MIANVSRFLLLSGCLCVSESVVFKLFQVPKTFPQSSEDCKAHSDGLAEVYSEELHRYLVEVTGVNRVWFGVTKCGSNWCLTGSNQPVSYTKWGSGEPSNRILAYEYCAELHSDHKWNSVSCSSSKYYVCQEFQCKPTTCNSRGNCNEMANDFTCDCEHVFSGKNCEHVQSCPAITKPSHGSVKCEGLYGEQHFQSECTFTCDVGFIPNGTTRTRCQDTGDWSSPGTTCRAVPCQALDSPQYGELNCSGLYGDTHYNASCYFSCDGGYVLHGDLETVCQDSGNWTSHDVQCVQLLLIVLSVIVGVIAMFLLLLTVITCFRKRKKGEERTQHLHNIQMSQMQRHSLEEGRYAEQRTRTEVEADEGPLYINNSSLRRRPPSPHKGQDIYENL
eukprot:gi/632983515/ref/XP_007908685.1/ PREDICTED: L-selectin-like isoform X1 [Callorhinchus milii]